MKRHKQKGQDLKRQIIVVGRGDKVLSIDMEEKLRMTIYFNASVFHK